MFQSAQTFAEFIAKDDELFVFRRFDRLNARNLLYLQSELISLEAQLQEYDDEDAGSGSKDVELSARCWETLALKAEDCPHEAERMELIKKIRKITKEYSKALLLQSQLLKVGKPNQRVWDVFSDWFRRNKPYYGHSIDLVQRKDDFLALKASAESDRLSGKVENWTGLAIAFLRRGSVQKDGTIFYSDRIVKHIIILLGITTATVSLEAPIVALHFAGNDNLRFGLIAIFSVLFATAVSFLSNARLVELFGASAAYAAVLVVFLANDLGS